MEFKSNFGNVGGRVLLEKGETLEVPLSVPFQRAELEREGEIVYGSKNDNIEKSGDLRFDGLEIGGPDDYLFSKSDTLMVCSRFSQTLRVLGRMGAKIVLNSRLPYLVSPADASKRLDPDFADREDRYLMWGGGDMSENEYMLGYKAIRPRDEYTYSSNPEENSKILTRRMPVATSSLFSREGENQISARIRVHEEGLEITCNKNTLCVASTGFSQENIKKKRLALGRYTVGGDL